MLIAVVYAGGQGDAQVATYGEIAVADLAAASWAVYQVADRLRAEWPVIGQRQNIVVRHEGDEQALEVEPEDVLITVRWAGRRPVVEYLDCTAPTPEQAYAGAMAMEEMARHHIRRALGALDVQQMQQQAARDRLMARSPGPDWRMQ